MVKRTLPRCPPAWRKAASPSKQVKRSPGDLHDRQHGRGRGEDEKREAPPCSKCRNQNASRTKEGVKNKRTGGGGAWFYKKESATK